jgi:hypothetical protein
MVETGFWFIVGVSVITSLILFIVKRVFFAIVILAIAGFAVYYLLNHGQELIDKF